jgi:hypothetical protein
MTTDALLQNFLMFVVVPAWLLAGLVDWFCHRRACIELTSGVRESLLHALQFSQVGIPLLAALFLQINAAVLLVMLAGLVLHQATAIWDVWYADGTRGIAPTEQHIHGVLEMIPVTATAIVVILHWPGLLSLFGVGEAGFGFELKEQPLPEWYLYSVLVAVVLLGLLPYGEELLRTWRAAAVRAARVTTARP